MHAPRLALFCLYDFAGAAELAHQLAAAGYTVVAGGATAAHLASQGVPVIAAEQVTGVPDILEGRVQMLHPALFGGILAQRERPDHLQALLQFSVSPVDLVIANLRPLPELISQLAAVGVPEEEWLAHADATAAALLRTAAGNFSGVVTLVDPADYAPVCEQLFAGQLGIAHRKALAAKAFLHLAQFDDSVATYLGGEHAPLEGAVRRQKFAATGQTGAQIELSEPYPLQGGENPQQSAWYHQDRHGVLAEIPQIVAEQVRDLPYSAFMDADLAWAAVKDMPAELACAVVCKHGNPCGAAALQTSIAGALLRACDADPYGVSGAVLAVNRTFDLAAARALGDRPVSVVVAPYFDEEAIDVLATKPHLRPIALGHLAADGVRRLVHVTNLGVLLEEPDSVPLDISNCLLATRLRPTQAQLLALDIAWRMAKHVKSNAVVIADEFGTVGIGAGQVSRTDAAVIAGGKCRKGYKPVAAASDGQLTGPEVLEIIAKAGVRAFVQPGGNPNDAAIAAAADSLGMAMLLTGVSHYRH